MRAGVGLVAIAAVLGAIQPPQTTAPLDAAFARYWDARNPNDAAKAASDIVKAAPAFDEVYARLQRGRTYARTPPTGVIRGRRGGRFEYWLNVPASYDPARRYQARIQLHGGVMRPDASLRGDGSVRLIVDAVKRTYNVDENRVALSGVSDGGTGAYYIALRDTPPYASFLPLNG